ncbi:MAG: sulfite exporter TauE/SafE family protein [Pseudomonadota bacterium]
MTLIWDALATPGLWWIAIGAFLAGTVRGFAGFGTGMIYLPFASAVLSPVGAILSLTIMDGIGPLPVIPSALRTAPRKPLILLIAGMALFLPIGLMVLTLMAQTTFQWVIGSVTLLAVALLIGGFRFPGAVTAPVWFGTGAAVGLLGGAVGVPGPPAILVSMASTMGPAAIRAVNMVLLFSYDAIIFPMMWLQGMFSLTPVLIGAIMLVPYLVGLSIGTAIFDPTKEKTYRGVAYAVITFAALMALPVWGG